MLRRYKVIVAYDGTDYLGWQEQAQGTTVAGVLQQSFRQVFKKDIKLLAASRTDAGVHALGQVATFTTDLALDAERLLQAWSNKLPRAIHIRELEEVPPGFNPHHNVIEKTYRYVFSLKRQLPFDARYIWYYRRPIDEQKLRESLEIFVGEHDFRSFCSSEYTGNTVRKIHEITLACDTDNYVITFKAPGFLRYMIRRIVGACLHVASHRLLTIGDLKITLANRNPEHTLESAPARGLTLLAVQYKEAGHHDRVSTVG